MVDGLEQDLADTAQVIRLNLQDVIGREIAARRGVRLVPTFLVLGGNGREVERHQGMPDRMLLAEALRRAAAQPEGAG